MREIAESAEMAVIKLTVLSMKWADSGEMVKAVVCDVDKIMQEMVKW